MRDWIDVAVLAKTRNLNGRFVVRATAGLPFLLAEGDTVAFVPPQLDVPRQAVVEDVRLVDKVTAEVSFEGIGAIEAGALVGSHCLVKRSELDEGMHGHFSCSWEGWTVVDDSLGKVGVVSEIIEYPGQMLLEVLRPDGNAVLVPIVDEIVLSVDPDAGLVNASLPTGLLDV